MVGVTDGCEVQPWSSPVEARKPPSRNELLGSDKCTARGERPRPPYRHTEEVTDSIPALLCPYDLAVPLAFRAFLRARRAFWPTATCADGVCRVLATSPTAADLSALSPPGDASGPQSLSGRGLTCSSLGPDSLSGFAAAALAARSSESIFRQRSTIRSRENIPEKPYFQHAAATKR